MGPSNEHIRKLLLADDLGMVQVGLSLLDHLQDHGCLKDRLLYLALISEDPTIRHQAKQYVLPLLSGRAKTIFSLNLRTGKLHKTIKKLKVLENEINLEQLYQALFSRFINNNTLTLDYNQANTLPNHLPKLSLRELTIKDYPAPHLPDLFINNFSLETIQIRGCQEIQSLPKTIYELPHLKRLWLRGCPQLRIVQANFSRPEDISIWCTDGTP